MSGALLGVRAARVDLVAWGGSPVPPDLCHEDYERWLFGREDGNFTQTRRQGLGEEAFLYFYEQSRKGERACPGQRQYYDMRRPPCLDYGYMNTRAHLIICITQACRERRQGVCRHPSCIIGVTNQRLPAVMNGNAWKRLSDEIRQSLCRGWSGTWRRPWPCNRVFLAACSRPWPEKALSQIQTEPF